MVERGGAARGCLWIRVARGKVLRKFGRVQSSVVDVYFVQLAAEELPAAVACSPQGRVAGGQEVVVLRSEERRVGRERRCGYGIDIKSINRIGIGHRYVMPAAIGVGRVAGTKDWRGDVS